jgi:hypothetical protein
MKKRIELTHENAGQIKIEKVQINLYSHFVAGKAMGERMSQNKSGG